MKKIFKVNFMVLLIAIFGILLTKQVNAVTVNYGKITNGTCTVTVTFEQDITNTSWTDWTKNGKTATKQMSSGEIAYLSVTNSENVTEEAIIAVPIEAQVGDIIDLSKTGVKNLSIANSDIATIDGLKVTAKKAGETTLKGTVQFEGNTKESNLAWKFTVTSDSNQDSGSGSDSGEDSGSGSGDQGNSTVSRNFSFSFDTTQETNPSLKISGLGASEDKSYKYVISSNNAVTPDVSTANVIYSKNNDVIISGIGEKIALNSEQYLWLWEDDKLVINAEKITKPEIPTGLNAFNSICHLAFNSTNIAMKYPFGDLSANGRKLNIKIGRISDREMLKKLNKNPNDSSLLQYAKDTDSIYLNTLTCNEGSGYSTTDKKLPDLDESKIENGVYYYVYVSLDDENGKYIPVESVTFAQASKIDSGEWFLFLYGTLDFKWPADIGDEDQKKDPSVAKEDSPNTGEKSMYAVFAALIALVVILGRRFRKLKI